ncbi:hypothetical protein [Halorientalis pallida]|uniref:Uncharacterized protein n=1 Tax=Halorientalis pallida TaxID=2479928 RepID=A0A498KYE4_9EURY|nr:hypothetical protein [Halorientalis pallida]RXK51089.1 hypothetical protein EAF64_00085 [Halorientalis pallida]
MCEVALLWALFGLVAATLVGIDTPASPYSRTLRLGALGFLAVELLIPLWVFLDLRGREEVGEIWSHVSAMPVVNVFGLLGYVEARNRQRD